MSSNSQRLIQHISEMEEDDAVSLAQSMLDDGYDPITLLTHCREAMEIVGARFESGDYFLPDLMLAGEMLTIIGAMAKPLIKENKSVDGSRGKTVVIGTVHGDLHDIGLNIVEFMLDINGFDVINLGIDVPTKDFIEAIKEHQPKVLGLSGFLTLAFDSMKETTDAIVEAGLRDNLKVIIGGGQVDERVQKYVGADAFGRNAMDAVAYSTACYQ
jgi:5-methyltetrahydrofolate--homocysteine methyltransferase